MFITVNPAHWLHPLPKALYLLLDGGQMGKSHPVATKYQRSWCLLPQGVLCCWCPLSGSPWRFLPQGLNISPFTSSSITLFLVSPLEYSTVCWLPPAAPPPTAWVTPSEHTWHRWGSHHSAQGRVSCRGYGPLLHSSLTQGKLCLGGCLDFFQTGFVSCSFGQQKSSPTCLAVLELLCFVVVFFLLLLLTQ